MLISVPLNLIAEKNLCEGGLREDRPSFFVGIHPPHFGIVVSCASNLFQFIMKKLLFGLIFGALAFTANGQTLSYGPVVGVGNSTLRIDDVVSDPGLSYHVGGFVRAKLLFLYVQPELVFQSLRTGNDITNVHNRFDVPVNIGWKLLMFDLNTGPVLHLPIYSETGGVDDLDIYADAASSWQFGLGVELGPVHVGARYQWGISNVLDTDAFDTRWRQFYVHLEYQL